MMTLDEKFRALETDNAPGQEARQEIGDLNAIMRGEKFDGIPVTIKWRLIPGFWNLQAGWKNVFVNMK